MRAAKLAAAIIESVVGLDDEAFEQAKAFMDLARAQPSYAAELLTEKATS